MSFLGLDLGEKRVGVAHSDELNLMAYSVGFIERRSNDFLIQEIKRLISEFRVDKIVIGFPMTMKGETGKEAQKAAAFAEFIGEEISCPIVTWDERLTTVQAEKVLIGQDVNRAKRRKKRDGIAAEIMLQSYLDFLNNNKGQ